jgi:putative restriction endonuclease
MPEPDMGLDLRLRDAAMAWLDDRASRGQEFVHREELASFTFEGQRIPLIDPQRGIRKPAILEEALSIQTTFTRPGQEPPYSDREGRDGLLRYKYRGEDPEHPENVALRRAYERQLPLLWFVGIAAGIYLPRYPIWLVADEPEQLQFVVAMDASQGHIPTASPMEEAVRDYLHRVTKQRLHQPLFRARVLQAYETRCALCQLRHGELLDAAHILPDTHPRGRPVVPNGLALCKIHHAAYDQNILGIRPDLYVEVRQDILTEIDGPMLQHGLQEAAGMRVSVPRSKAAKPDSSSLEERYEEFRSAA